MGKEAIAARMFPIEIDDSSHSAFFVIEPRPGRGIPTPKRTLSGATSNDQGTPCLIIRCLETTFGSDIPRMSGVLCLFVRAIVTQDIASISPDGARHRNRSGTKPKPTASKMPKEAMNAI